MPRPLSVAFSYYALGDGEGGLPEFRQTDVRTINTVACNGYMDLVRSKDNPTSSSASIRLFPRKRDEYMELLKTAKRWAAEGVEVRESIITDELYGLIVFLTLSFVRPTDTELYGFKHRHVKIVEWPQSLLLTIQDGRTGFRYTNTMPADVAVDQRFKARYAALSGPDDPLPFFKCRNRGSSKRIARRQFNALLK